MGPITNFYDKEVSPAIESCNKLYAGILIFALMTEASIKLAKHRQEKHKFLKHGKCKLSGNTVVQGYTVNQWIEMHKKFMSKYGNKLIDTAYKMEISFEKDYLDMKNKNPTYKNLPKIFIKDEKQDIQCYFSFPYDHPASISSMCDALPIGSIVTTEEFKDECMNSNSKLNETNLKEMTSDTETIKQIKNIPIEVFIKYIEDTNKLYMKHVNNFKRDTKAIGIPVKSVYDDHITEEYFFRIMYAEFDFNSIADLKDICPEN